MIPEHHPENVPSPISEAAARLMETPSATLARLGIALARSLNPSLSSVTPADHAEQAHWPRAPVCQGCGALVLPWMGSLKARFLKETRHACSEPCLELVQAEAQQQRKQRHRAAQHAYTQRRKGA